MYQLINSILPTASPLYFQADILKILAEFEQNASTWANIDLHYIHFDALQMAINKFLRWQLLLKSLCLALIEWASTAQLWETIM